MRINEEKPMSQLNKNKSLYDNLFLFCAAVLILTTLSLPFAGWFTLGFLAAAFAGAASFIPAICGVFYMFAIILVWCVIAVKVL